MIGSELQGPNCETKKPDQISQTPLHDVSNPAILGTHLANSFFWPFLLIFRSFQATDF